MQYTRPLAELRRADEARFGGKSASLGELLAAGIPVPPGFALSTSAMRAPVHDEIAARYAELSESVREPSPAVAVRSSAVGEDSADATFAGQLESYLWVRGVDEICVAVRDCWASLNSVRAQAYREHLGAEHEAATGVTIQLMVDAAVSGVMFTCNPVSGDPSMVAINASWGLGLAVVGGEVTPDDYLVSKVTREVVRERISTKDVEYRPAADGRGTERTEVPPDRANVRCLDEQALTRLVDLARQVERHFGCHQDIEWAIRRSDRELFVLQSRPVTSLPERPPKAPASALSLVMSQFGVPPHASD